MMSQEENERFTRVGPGTPMGKLLRRYWHPVGCTPLVTSKPQRVNVLGEELVLYRGASGQPVLMELRCAHRNVALDYGRVEGESIRCPYHGWVYDQTGQCTAQPAEAEGSRFKEKIKLASYRTQEVSGLVFAYMGPEPAPVLPLYDVLRMENGFKNIMLSKTETSFMNAVENIVDQSHLSWLHGHTFPAYGAKKISYHVERADYGAKLDMSIEGLPIPQSTPYFFPTINRFALPAHEPGKVMDVLLYRVPSTDTTHENYFVAFIRSEKPIPADKRVINAVRRDGKFGDYKPLEGDWWGIDLSDQDRMAFEQQGAIPDRTKEHLVPTDSGIILMRRMMREGFEAIEKGEDPPCIIRDPAKQNVEFKLTMAGIDQNRQEKQDYSVGLGGVLKEQASAIEHAK